MAETTTIQLYGGGDGDNIANVDMPDDGLLLSAHMACFSTGAAADLDAFAYQLSFGATSSFTSNDARSVIMNAGASYDLVGAGANIFRTDVNQSIYFGEDGIKLFGGERIYLHGLPTTNGLNTVARALLVVRFSKFTPRRR